jgi:hypothetical protein
MSKMIEILVTNNQREDILYGLRKWLKETPNMKEDSQQDLNNLIAKIDCAGYVEVDRNE